MKQFKYFSVPPKVAEWFTGTVMYNVKHPKYGNHQLTQQQIKYAPADFKDKLFQNIKDAYESDDAMAKKIDKMYNKHHKSQGKNEGRQHKYKKLDMLSLYERAGKNNMFDKEYEYSKEERNAFMEAVKNYGVYGEVIRRSDSLKEVIEEITEMVELASDITLKETDGWFDNVTASRHSKRMKEAVKVLQKEAQEIIQRQQRLEAAYEDIGQLLGRYYEV